MKQPEENPCKNCPRWSVCKGMDDECPVLEDEDEALIYCSIKELEAMRDEILKELMRPEYDEEWAKLFAFMDANPGLTFEEIDRMYFGEEDT